MTTNCHPDRRPASFPLFCHPDRSGPIFPFAPISGASGRVVEGSLPDLSRVPHPSPASGGKSGLLRSGAFLFRSSLPLFPCLCDLCVAVPLRLLPPPQKQKSRKSSRPAADQHNAAVTQPLAGGESSLGYNPHETFAVLAPLAIPHRGRPRKTRRLSGQVAETPPNPSRVRVECAGRAHCREFTPNPVINLTLSLVNMKSPKNSPFRQKSLATLECGGLFTLTFEGPPLFHS